MAKKKLTNDKVLRNIDGHYYIFKVQKRLDSKIYHAHAENNKIVISRMHEEICADDAKEYLLSMKENIEKAYDAKTAEDAYIYNMKGFGLMPEEEVEQLKEEVEQPSAEQAEGVSTAENEAMVLPE